MNAASQQPARGLVNILGEIAERVERAQRTADPDEILSRLSHHLTTMHEELAHVRMCVQRVEEQVR